MKRIIGIFISLVAVAAVGATVFYAMRYMKNSRENVGMGGGRPARNANTAYAVRTQVAEVETLDDYIHTNGNIEALSSVSVYPNMGGKIVSASVVLGSKVTRGDTIAQIDPSQPGVKYALSPVVAPISGTVISTPLDVGTTVSTASVIAILGDISGLQVRTYVPEKYVGYMRTGLRAEILLEAYPDVPFAAKVSYVSPVLDTATRTKEIVLRFDGTDARVNAGMFAKIKLYTVQHKGHVAVPSSAIVTNAERRYVYVVKDDSTVERREVVEGNIVDGRVQIISGISGGERVVTEGGTSLYDGASINDISNR